MGCASFSIGRKPFVQPNFQWKHTKIKGKSFVVVFKEEKNTMVFYVHITHTFFFTGFFPSNSKPQNYHGT